MHPSGAERDAPLVRLRDVHLTLGANKVLRGIDLDVRKGDTTSIIGPSGAGKSSILRCINGLLAPDRGEITVGSTAVHTLKTEAEQIALRKRIGFVFQQYNLFPHKTALENIMMAPITVLKQDRAEVEARARALLKKVRLAGKEGAYPGELSGGQQQRVAIARSLAMRPDVMLFDEVTAALDPETKKDVLTTIQDLARDGMTCLVVTHEMGFAREVSNRVYFTEGGLIVEHAPPAEFFSNPQDPRTREFLSQVL